MPSLLKLKQVERTEERKKKREKQQKKKKNWTERILSEFSVTEPIL